MPVFNLGYAPSGHRSNRPGYNGTSLQEFFSLPGRCKLSCACVQGLLRTRPDVPPLRTCRTLALLTGGEMAGDTAEH